MVEKTLYIAFKGQQVSVSSNASEILEKLEQRFCEMLEPYPKNTIRRLEVFRKGKEYQLIGGGETNNKGRSLAGILRCLNKEVIEVMIKANTDLLWLRAGAAVNQGNAVIFVGPWRSGKSILVTNLCEFGWSYMSDDILPLDINSGKIIPFFHAPFGQNNNEKKLTSQSPGELKKIKYRPRLKNRCKEPMLIDAIMFPAYDYESPTAIYPCSPANAVLEILQSCLNFENHRESAVRYICKLAERLPTLIITFNSGKLAAEQIVREHKNWHCNCI